MNWMDKLERKWGRHAVANLSRYFVLAQVIGYVVQLMAPGLMSYCLLYTSDAADE